MAISFVGVGTAQASSGGSTGSLNVPLPTGLQVGDLVLIFCSGRNTGYVFTATGYTQKWSLDHASSGINTIVLLYRIRQSGDADTVTVSWTGGATNATVIMQACAFRGVNQSTPFDVQGATSSNASQANIGPITGITTGSNGKCTIVFGHRADDWTSVDILTGDGLTWNEIGEPDSSAGTDAGMVWDYAIHGASQTITNKTFTVTGGAAQTGMGVMQSLNEAVAVIVERNVGEPSISVSDATERAIRRDMPVSEPSISVADSPSHTLQRALDVSEPSISVSDGVSYVLRRIKEISETSISVSDGLEVAVRRILELSEVAISISDSVETLTVRSRDLSEPSITVSDEASYLLRRIMEIAEASVSVSDGVSTEVITAMPQRSVTEPLGSITDALEVAVRRFIELSEPAISVGDSVIAAFVKIVSVSELIGGAAETPKLIITLDGHLVLRITKPSQEKPQYIIIK